MSELELLDSPKVVSSSERRSSAISSWGDSNTPDKDEVPVHLFLSPTHSGSTHSSSSHSRKVRQRRLKKSTQETSFISTKPTSKEDKTEKICSPSKDDIEAILSSPGRSRDYSTSESEETSSAQDKTKKIRISKSKSVGRTNKVHDYTVQERNNILKLNEIEINSSRSIQVHRYDTPSIEESSVDTEIKRSGTSMSEMSYRERIRDRFNTMKERAVESLSRPQSRPQSRLKLLMSRPGSSRIEEVLKQEESEVSAAMERHEQMKKRWREVSKASLEHKSQEEANMFFTETEDQVSASETPAEEVKSPSKTESSSDIQTEEDSKVLTSELLGIREDWDLVEFSKPTLTNVKNNKLWEEKLFCPSTAPVSMENKIEPGLNPRYMEEEGHYVGTKLKLPKKLKNKMEQRLTMTPDGRKWFGKDGELISSICPLKPVSTRPYIDEDSTETTVQVTYKPATLGDANHRYMDLSGNLNYVLDIEIASVEFSHHPLFSKEHVLAQRLKELYIKYKKRSEMDNLNRLTGRLNALRRTRDNLKNLINAGGDNLNLREELEKYENDIKEIRQLRYIEGQIDKQLTDKIISTWKDLVKVREQQGYQSTQLKFTIKKKVAEDLKEEKAKWDAGIKLEVKEIVEELRKNYEKELDVYKEKHEIWSRTTKKKFRLQKPENEDLIEKLSGTESANESETESEDNLEDEPKPPEPVVTSDVKAQVIENFKESFKRPGEPEIQLIMSKATNLDVSAYNNKEELRRSAVKRYMVFVKLFYNGKEVCRSKNQPLTQNFSVNISQRFAIRILEWPESLMLEIHEESGTLNRNLLVPGIYLPFPDSFMTVQNSEIIKHEFSSNISVSYHHTAVGSGNKIIPCPDGSDYNNQPLCLFTSGTIACRVGWLDNHCKILAPPEKYWSNRREETNTNLSEILKSGGSFNISKLKEWAKNSKLDPNDPYNSTFFQFLENAGDSLEMKPTYFRLDPLLDEFDFCKENEIQDNVRLKLLKLRDMGEPEFRDMKMVPLNEKQIHKEIFKDYEKRMSKPYSLTDVLSTDPLDGHRIWGKKYLEQVQEKLLKQLKTSRQNRRFQDIITEENVPDIGTLGLTFMKWLQPRRPLRPVRKERKKITPQNLSGQEINIVVNVVRAFEVPVRKDVDSMSTSESIEGFSLVNVRPFVEISFRGVTAKTTAAEGANPTWNQDLKIPLANKNGSIQTIKDNLYLNLFDEVVIDLIEDDSARETNIHQRLERHWLASMKIPFSTLYFNTRIEGTFKLYSPPVLLGYEREAHRRHGSTVKEPLLPQRDATYITLFVTVQPALNPPKPIKEKMGSSEMEMLEKHLEGWQQEITNIYPHRKIKTLVLDTSGKSVCVTRYIKPLSPPTLSEEETITPEMAARFVAMIPPISESAVSPGLFDIWLTSDQILRLICGNAEDHAILLCSYFLHLGLKAYVLLGTGIPHGLMAYVLVREQVEKRVDYFVWDPTTGQKYNIDDSFCPLQKVFCLINNQNIWANVQNEEMPRRTKFDLTKRADWFPAFGKNIAAPTESVQPESIQYKTTSRQAVNFLQDKIEKKLRDNLMKWRRRSRTQWNRYCVAILRRLLPKLEEATWNIKDSSPDHIQELHHILASHKMCGFPINMPYTNIEAVIEAVKATGVHLNETENIEFALAVYIHTYPNDVLSVWVYVASLIRRR